MHLARTEWDRGVNRLHKPISQEQVQQLGKITVNTANGGINRDALTAELVLGIATAALAVIILDVLVLFTRLLLHLLFRTLPGTLLPCLLRVLELARGSPYRPRP